MRENVFGSRLRAAMVASGLNQVALVNRIKEQSGRVLQRQSISQYCLGLRKPDTERLAQLCNALNVSADWLIGLSDVKSRNTDIQQICEYTGLTEDAVNLLCLLGARQKERKP